MTLQPQTINDAHTNDVRTNDFYPGDVSESDVCANKPAKPPIILLAEDEPFVREATCGILHNAGFEVLPVADVADAKNIFAAREGAIDLLMTDMVLPGGNGRELGQYLRQRSPDLAVLVTSGYDNPEFETESPESRTYFLAKPYSRRTLLDTIERILAPPEQARSATQAG
jgi:DNA-binding NtrC family response regulator